MIFSHRTKRKIHNGVLKTITGIAAVALLIGVCALDSLYTNIPVYMCFISELWLCLFGYANDLFNNYDIDDEWEEDDNL